MGPGRSLSSGRLKAGPVGRDDDRSCIVIAALGGYRRLDLL